MKKCGPCNVRKHKDIKGSDKYFTLDISLKFDSRDKMKITSLGSNEKLERSGKRLITSLGFKTKVRLKKLKKARYAIGNVSKKDISKIIRKFEKFEKLPYEKKRPKNEPTDRYFYLSRQLAKCMMRSDTLNWHNYGGYAEMTAPSLNVYSMDKEKHETLLQNCSMVEGESKCSLVNKNLSQDFSTNEDKSKGSIVNENLSQNCSVDKEYLSSTEEDKS